MFVIRNFPLQSNSLCHFRYQVGRLLTRMLTQSQWGMPPRHSRKRMSRIFRGFRSGHRAQSPEPEGAGSTGDGDRSPRPQRGEFSQFWRRENLHEVASARRRANALSRSLPKPSGWARLCNAEDVCGAMIGCLVVLGSTDGHTKFSHRVPELAFVMRRSLESKRVWWRTFAGFDKRRHTGAGAQGSLSRANR